MSVHSPSSSKEGTTSTQVQKFLLEGMKDVFPDLESCSYFVPPVKYMPTTRQSNAGQNVVLSKTSPTTAVNSIGKDDAAMQRVLFSLNELAHKQREVLVGLSNLHMVPSPEREFYSSGIAVEPSPYKSRERKHLVVDVLLIHRYHGLFVCEVKSVVTSTDEKKLIEKDLESKLKEAIKQLEQSEAMLSHLVSDITGGLRIIKAIAVPDVTSGQLQRLISADSQLAQDLCRCLGTTDPADIVSLCLCSDQLSDPRATREENINVLRELGNWWQRRVAKSGNDSIMNRELYMKLVTRFYEQVKETSTRLYIMTQITGQITQKTSRRLFVHSPPSAEYDFSIRQVKVEVSVPLPQSPKLDEAASPSKRDKLGKRAGSDREDSSAKSTGSDSRGGRVKIYLHAVTDVEANLLKNTGYTQPLQEVTKKTGADLQFDSNQSSVPGMKILRIRGVPKQIEEAVRLINQMTGVKKTISAQAQSFWLQWVEAAFPDLDSRPYFLPPVYFNRVPMTRQLFASQDVLVLQAAPKNVGQSNQQALTVTGTIFRSGRVHEQDVRNDAVLEKVDGQDVIKTEHEQTSQSSQSIKTSFAFPPRPTVLDSDIRDDSAFQRVLICLQELSERNLEVLFGLSQLQFGQYLGEPCYAAAAAQLPLPANLPSALPRNWKQGDFDVLLIHRHYGLVVCEVKSFGDNVKAMNMSQQDIDNNIKKKLKEATFQLDKAEAMLSHLVSDIAPGLHITKTIAFPNLTAQQVQKAVSCETKLIQELCRCLGTTTDPADITSLCLCCDQLSDPKTPCDVSSHVLRELGHWWQRRVAGAGHDTHMTPGVYKTLVARFCGPATTVSVPCTCPPRVSVKTLGQAVWCTGECYTAVITLFPEQVHLLHTAPPTLFVTGPPGTGKTVVLLLMAIQWLRCGHHVYIVSTCDESRAACIMLYHLLIQTVKTQQSAGVSPGQPHLLQYDLDDGKDVEKAVNDLSQAASGGSLYVIADEAGPEYMTVFKTFCEKLLVHIPRLHLWAASCFHGNAPAGWQVEYLTRPLRSPPAVVREVKRARFISDYRDVQPYSERGAPDHTDGPPVRRLYHRRIGHTGSRPEDCITCGREVASFLHSLRVGVTENATTSTTVITINSYTTHPYLQWRDVLVLSSYKDGHMPGIVKGLEEAGIPVRVMMDDDIEDVATARSDVVWVANGDRVRGLERKVVVCLDRMSTVRLHLLSRCTSQLVIVCPDD